MAEATRRSSRRAGTRLPSELDETYASIRKLKAAGKSRLADYEVKEEAPLYDEVDEEQYKQIAEQKRKEAKEFLVGKIQLRGFKREYSAFANFQCKRPGNRILIGFQFWFWNSVRRLRWGNRAGLRRGAGV